MSPKGYKLIFTSHSFTSLHSGFSKGNLGLYVGKSVCDKNQVSPLEHQSGDGTVGKSWTTDLRISTIGQ